jgi:hypothetical protein
VRPWRRREGRGGGDAGVWAESGDHGDRLRDERHLHRLRLRAPHLRPRCAGRRRRGTGGCGGAGAAAATRAVRLRRRVPQRRGSRPHGERPVPAATLLACCVCIVVFVKHGSDP